MKTLSEIIKDEMGRFNRFQELELDEDQIDFITNRLNKRIEQHQAEEAKERYDVAVKYYSETHLLESERLKESFRLAAFGKEVDDG